MWLSIYAQLVQADDPDTEPDIDSASESESSLAANDSLVEEPSYTSVIVGKRPLPTGTVSRIDSKEISLRGARNLTEALALEPGVEMNQSPKAGAVLQVRGFDERTVLLMLEGIPIREVYDGHFDIASLPVFNLGSIELERGVTSTLFGPNSAGGIVSLVAPSECDQTADISVFGRPAQKDRSLYGGRFKLCAKVSDLVIHASVGHEQSEGYPLSGRYEETENNAQFHEKGGVRDGSDYERSSIAFLAKYAPRRNKSVTLFADVVSAPRSIPPFEGYGYTRYWRFESYNTLLLGLSGVYGPDSTPSVFGFREIKGQIYSHVHRDEIRDYEDATYMRLTENPLAWFVASAYANETIGANIQSAWSLNRGNRLDAALRYNLDIHRQREIPVPRNDTPTEWTSWERYLAHTFTAALEDTQTVGPFRLNAGFSASGMSLVAQEIRNTDYPVDHRIIPAFEGRLTGEYSPLEGFRLLIAAGHKVRYPTLKELFSNSIGGNPNLDSERAWIAETGFDIKGVPFKGFGTSVRVFGNVIRDLIESYRQVYANIGRSVIAGAELEMRYTPVSFLEFYSGYRYLYTRDLEHERPLDYRTPHRVVMGERLFTKIGITAALEAVFSSGQQAYYVDAVSGDWVEDNLSAYVVMNAHIRYERAVKGIAALYAYADGFNLTDNNYCIGSFEPRPGREFILGLGGRI